ncbi:hypothetical protein EHQ64_17985 [Leptospira sarikeiensis]|uniref:Uncharacterized protein n=1 Tax=Leptospira sarikeiensis TaxID=2484943 RepID=A0A4R9K2C3_9LEPT|nr:hypothetical protein EHQ64_17985 [Leptospira sarikeiensis]
MFWNSDALYLPSVLIDVIRDGGSLRTWSFAPTPYFFPDLPVIFLFGSITENVFRALLLYAILQTSLLTFLLGKFIRVLEPKMHYTHSYSLSLLTVSSLLLIADKFPMLYYLYFPSVHISAFLATLWIWPYLKREKVPKYSVFPLLSILTLSDRILILELYLPAVLAWARRYGRWGISFPLISIRFFATGLIGLGLQSLVKVFLTVNSPNKIPTLESLSNWGNDLITGILSLKLSAIFLLFAILGGILCLRKGKESGHSYGFLGYFQLSLCFLPPLFGLYSSENALKYSIPAFVFVPIFFGILPSVKNPTYLGHSRNFALLGLILSLGILSAFVEPPTNIRSWTQTIQPEETICVDEWKEKDSFVFVLSESRKAKRILTYSEKRVLAYPIDFSTLEGSYSVSNKEWFLFPPEGPVAVLPDGLGESRVKSFYGEPSRILECSSGNGKIWVYEETDKIRDYLQRPIQKTK